MQILREPFIGRAHKEESIAEFVSRRLGYEFLDYAIDPFVAGVFAGKAEQLSVRSAFPKLYALEKDYGGLIMGAIRGAAKRRRREEMLLRLNEVYANGVDPAEKRLVARIKNKLRPAMKERW